MIFLSHNSNDKPVVEQVALKLKNINGQDKIYYVFRKGKTIRHKKQNSEGIICVSFLCLIQSIKRMARLNCFKISVKKYVARTNVVIFVFWKMIKNGGCYL